MKRIAKSVFPGRFASSGNLRYIAVPSSVIDRMNLKIGDYLDVTVEWPEMEEYEIDDVPNSENMESSETENTDKKSKRRMKKEE